MSRHPARAPRRPCLSFNKPHFGADAEGGRSRAGVTRERVQELVFRSGLGEGEMLRAARDGDYYGRTVIVAARIASEAGPGQVLVGETVTAEASPDGVRFEEVRPVPLDGIARPVNVYRAVRASA